MFRIFIIANFTGRFDARKYAKGTTTRVSKASIISKYSKNLGSRSTIVIIGSLKIKTSKKNRMVEPVMVMNAVEKTLDLSPEVLKYRKNAVSIP